jgi:hypothetical protein
MSRAIVGDLLLLALGWWYRFLHAMVATSEVGSWRWTPRTAHDAILGRPWRGIGPDGKAKQAGGRHIATVARMVQWPLRAATR